MRRLPKVNPSIPEGLASGTMQRIPREHYLGDSVAMFALKPELIEWLEARTTREAPTHRIIHTWGILIEIFDDEFEVEFALTWGPLPSTFEF